MGCGHRTVEQECTLWPPGAVHILDATPHKQDGVLILTRRVAALCLLRNRELGVGGDTGLEGKSTLATSEASCCQVTLYLGGYTSLHHCSLTLCSQGCPDTLGSCFSPALPSPKFYGEDLHASGGRSQALSVSEVVPCPSQGTSSHGPGHCASPTYRSLQKNQSVEGSSCHPNICDS